ncbi:unnamed protein product [Urochloa decumbens]|uniref:DUF1618 domain-containing protein n=1 Tax=Urochloa decumbens TaxID=240449 RepID=A0ABC9HFB7_9POAL
MAPAPCVVLDRTVPFRDHPRDTEPPSLEAPGVVGGNISAQPLSLQDLKSTVGDYLMAMTPVKHLVDPPGVSRLTMLRPPSSHWVPKFGRRMQSGFVAAADNCLVVIYAGTFRPGASFSGWYLLLDLESCSSRPVPGIPCSSIGPSATSAGYGTAVLALPRGVTFILAELFFEFPRAAQGLTSGRLCLWNSQHEQWVYKMGDLPRQVCTTWRAHMTFPVLSRCLLCWVDLLHGLLLCDLGRHLDEVDSVLDMSFVPLPTNSCLQYAQELLANPEDFRSMACVHGAIKFLTMDGFGAAISLITYTLHLDGPSPSWTKDTVLRLADLWADETYISTGMPQIMPLFPILSRQEHDIIYLVIPGQVEIEEGYRVRRCKLLLSVDTRKAKVVSTDRENHPETLFSSRYLITF